MVSSNFYIFIISYNSFFFVIRPNYDFVYKFPFSIVLSTPDEKNDKIKMICIANILNYFLQSINRISYFSQETLSQDHSSTKLIFNSSNLQEIDLHFEKIKNSVYLILEANYCLSGIWLNIIKQMKSSDSFISFFDIRPSLLPENLLPNINNLINIVEILNEILLHFQYLTKIYSYISKLYFDYFFNNSQLLENNNQNKYQIILESLMTDIELTSIQLINGWRSIILVIGSTLIQNTINNCNRSNGEDQNQNHFMLTYDSDGFEHQILTSADDITTSLVKSILKYTIKV